MFRALVSFIASLFLLGAGYCQNGNFQAQTEPINGDYFALEPMSNISPDDPGAKWFHENRLLVRNNEAILDMVPVWTKAGKKFYSASDGGFLTYRARFFQKDGKTFLNLRLFQSDYVALPVGTNPYKEIKTRSVKFESGEIYIDGVRYRRRAWNDRRRNELLQLLDKELVEKPPDR